MKHYVPLHLHTEYSLLDGAIKIKDLLSFAQKENWKAVGISDHGNIFGAVDFFKKSKKAGIKPILGTEMYFIPDAKIKDNNERYYHLLLIVQNKAGYQNLCRLMEFSYKDGYYFKPRIDLKALKKYSEGLIVSTGCVGGYVPKLLRHGQIQKAQESIEQFLDIFGQDHFLFEIMPEDAKTQAVTNKLILEQSKKYNITVIATTDAHYMNKDDYDAHEVLLAIQTKKTMDDPKRMSFGDFKCYMRTTQQMLEQLPNNHDAIWNTGKIADSCEFEFEFGKLFFPSAPIPKKHTHESYFKQICQQGLDNLFEKGLIEQSKKQIYQDRLEEEMDLIIDMGFIGYFLIVSDFIKWAKQQNIPVGPGRGSAAGSLVAWAMDITNVDPIKYNLLFERFLNPERITMPDIDIDFCVERREDVINHVKEKYGHDCVCQIITFGTMLAKGVIKDVARALGFPFQDSNAITDLIPNQLKITLKEAIEKEPKLKEMIDGNPNIKNLFQTAFKLEGLTRHASKHAAGVVISPKPMRDVLPLYIPTSKSSELITQYSMTDLEAVGYLKMDFLGLKNLTIVQKTIESIKENHGVQINLDKLTLDDPKTFQLLQNGQTNGVFQLESAGIKDVLRKLQPEKFEDIIAVNALYRPGPLGSGMVDDFIDRKHGRKKITYLFDELQPILQETYGVIVYQEQVMKIASAIAGYSLGESDILRRAMGKKKVEVMAQQKEKFVKGAITRKFNEKKSVELFDLMAYFAGYGFNKSHSTAYALIAYHTAYLKSNYTNEFMAALTSSETNDPDKLTFYLQEINELNLKIIPPNINKSKVNFHATKDGIVFGMKGIKNVGATALEKIIASRDMDGPFLDMLDFCKRVDTRSCNKRVIENLIYSGCMDNLPGNRAQKIDELDHIMEVANEAKELKKTGQTTLFDSCTDNDEKNSKIKYYEFKPLKDWDIKTKLQKEKESAGFYLSSHPLKSYKSLRWINCKSFKQTLENFQTNSRDVSATCIGLLKSKREITTKKGDHMAFAQFEDLSGNGEGVIFPRTYAKISDLLDQYNVFIIKGNLDTGSPDKCKILVNELIPIELLFENEKIINNVNLNLPNGFDQQTVEALSEKLPAGKTQLSFIFSENGETLKLQTFKKININPENLSVLEESNIKIQLSV